jgi:hypothetical protein
MATVTDVYETRENGVVVFSATLQYDGVTFELSSVTWTNPGPHRWRIAIITPGKADIVVTVNVGASGSRTGNQVRNYFIDGPQGAGWQMWTVS